MKNEIIIKNLDKKINALFNKFEKPVIDFNDKCNLFSLTESLKETIKDKIYSLCKKINTRIINNNPIDNIESLVTCLRKRIEIIDKKYFAYTHNTYLANDEIDLYLDENSEPMEYIKSLIYSHKTNEYVGYITYEKQTSDSLGNISYFVDYMYRGNNYAYKALVLLTDELYKQGINKINITTTTNNIASNKIIQKFGGIKIPYNNSNNVIMYKCDLNSIKSQKRKI